MSQPKSLARVGTLQKFELRFFAGFASLDSRTFLSTGRVRAAFKMWWLMETRKRFITPNTTPKSSSVTSFSCSFGSLWGTLQRRVASLISHLWLIHLHTTISIDLVHLGNGDKPPPCLKRDLGSLGKFRPEKKSSMYHSRYTSGFFSTLKLSIIQTSRFSRRTGFATLP